MASNRFGEVLVLTSFGESHGPCVGGVLDGFPAGLPLDLVAVQEAVSRRRPGSTSCVSPRQEADQVEWLSGIYQGCSTGAPLAFLIRNQGQRPSDYAEAAQVLRPGHATWTYLQKYGVFDPRGGGRASARETAVRVVAGALAEQWLAQEGVYVGAYLQAVGGLSCPPPTLTEELEAKALQEMPHPDNLFTCLPEFGRQVHDLLDQMLAEGDSVGGAVVGWSQGVPPGWGDPVYLKLEAQLAAAMLSLPASKGFEIGEGFGAIQMRGSTHNDPFCSIGGKVQMASNHAGGALAGISSGTPLWIRVAFKPASSIRQPCPTITLEGEPVDYSTPTRGRHDPCVAVRAVPVVRAMLALVLMDAGLRARLSRSQPIHRGSL